MSGRSPDAWPPTERAFARGSSESIPNAMMRVGWMRTIASSKLSPNALPPEPTISALPRISIMRGWHGGNTSSTTMDARPVRPTSRSFFV
jgi:hypothetical protein